MEEVLVDVAPVVGGFSLREWQSGQDMNSLKGHGLMYGLFATPLPLTGIAKRAKSNVAKRNRDVATANASTKTATTRSDYRGEAGR